MLDWDSPIHNSIKMPHVCLKHDFTIIHLQMWLVHVFLLRFDGCHPSTTVSDTLCPLHRTSLLRTLLQKMQRNSRAADPRAVLPPAHVNFTLLVLIILKSTKGNIWKTQHLLFAFDSLLSHFPRYLQVLGCLSFHGFPSLSALTFYVPTTISL